MTCGTSAAEMVCEWTYDALKSIRDVFDWICIVFTGTIFLNFKELI
jgi:hypothetical protein